MAILQFGFGKDCDKSPHHPSNINSMQIVYTGTHDNDTLLAGGNHNDVTKANVRSIIDDMRTVGSMIRY